MKPAPQLLAPPTKEMRAFARSHHELERGVAGIVRLLMAIVFFTTFRMWWPGLWPGLLWGLIAWFVVAPVIGWSVQFWFSIRKDRLADAIAAWDKAAAERESTAEDF